MKFVAEALFGSCGGWSSWSCHQLKEERLSELGWWEKTLWKPRQGREYGVSIIRTALQGGSCLSSSPSLTPYIHGTQAWKGSTLGHKNRQ